MQKGITKSDSLAEWSKALASGASPQGRGFEPHSCQLGVVPNPESRKCTQISFRHFAQNEAECIPGYTGIGFEIFNTVFCYHALYFF